jgi:hypothetical protein
MLPGRIGLYMKAIAFKRIFPNEHFVLWSLISLVTVNFMNDLGHAVQSRIFLKSFMEIFWFRWMQFGVLIKATANQTL